MKRIKLAMMGCSHGHARGYYGAFCSHPDFEPVAYSVRPGYENRVFLEKLPPEVPRYFDDKQMLDEHPEIEAVVISSENSSHLEQVRLCAERGIHILSMKVPSYDMAEYEEIKRLCAENNVVCLVELEFHYTSIIRRAKELVDEGRIGKLLAFNAYNYSHQPACWLPWHAIPEESYGKRIPLRPGDDRMRGGGLADHPHVFDIARYFTDSEYDFVYADVGNRIRKDHPVEELIHAVGRMKNGVIVSLDPSYARTETFMEVIGPGYEIYPKRVEVAFALHGTEGSLLVDVFGPCIHHTGLPARKFTTLIATGYGNTCRMDELAYCIRNHTMPDINLWNHQNTIRAMNAIYESVETGKPVKL